MKNIVVILASGTGERFGMNIPKQYFPIDDFSCLQHSVLRFAANELITDILVINHPDYMELAQKQISSLPLSHCNIEVLEGGKDRNDSTIKALKYIKANFSSMEVVFVHDAVRPYFPDNIISESILLLKQFDGTIPTIPVTDSVVFVEGDSINYLDRTTVFQVQTPQAFRKEHLLRAYHLFLEDPEGSSRFFSDNASLVQFYIPSIQLKTIAGSPNNIKMTHSQDISVLKNLLQNIRI